MRPFEALQGEAVYSRDGKILGRVGKQVTVQEQKGFSIGFLLERIDEDDLRIEVERE